MVQISIELGLIVIMSQKLIAQKLATIKNLLPIRFNINFLFNIK